MRSADGPTQAKVHASANGTHRLSARAPVSRFPLGISTARRARNQSPSPRPASRCSEAPSPPRVSECGEQFQADLVPRDRDASHRVVQGFGNVKYGAIVAYAASPELPAHCKLRRAAPTARNGVLAIAFRLHGDLDPKRNSASKGPTIDARIPEIHNEALAGGGFTTVSSRNGARWPNARRSPRRR